MAGLTLLSHREIMLTSESATADARRPVSDRFDPVDPAVPYLGRNHCGQSHAFAPGDGRIADPLRTLRAFSGPGCYRQRGPALVRTAGQHGLLCSDHNLLPACRIAFSLYPSPSRPHTLLILF